MKKQRIVVKIGSSSLTNAQGNLSEEKISQHVSALSTLKKAGHDVILISSGAVAAGFSLLGYPARPVTLSGKQASAAIGQGLLMQRYFDHFQKHGHLTAQLLLTRQVFSKEDQYTNVYSTVTELLKRSVIPIINENDSVAVDELTFGDNDRLSALVAGLAHADLLVILTDINGLYDQNPQQVTSARKITYLDAIKPETLSLAGDSGSKVGTGGMRSKLEAAALALSLGIPSFIGIAKGEFALVGILDGHGDGTYVGSPSLTSIVKKKKQWIQVHSPVTGQIKIDEGAAHALLTKGKSLLPAGVMGIYGTFNKHEVVEVLTMDGGVIGKGQVNFSAAELLKIKGLKSQEVKSRTQVLHTEVIHRDNWVTLKKERAK